MKNVIHIAVGGGYNIEAGSGLLPGCGEGLKRSGISGKIAVVTDSNVAPLYLETALGSLNSAGYETVSFVIPAGEKSKNITVLSDILEFFARSGLTREDCAAALGGGVTGDITGFASGCYMRGIACVQLPTTLLAAVDSSVGGKTAIDLAQGKNLAGLFVQPKAVICDTDTFSTLPPEVFDDGAAEGIKTAILGDAALFDIFESGNVRSQINEVVARCVSYKGKIVEADEFERGERKLLNLGHTPAHAIEKLSGYTVSHGHAVAAGTAIMARAAARLGKMSLSDAERIENTIAGNSLPVTTSFSAKELAAQAINDKKRTREKITAVIPFDIGRCGLVSVTLNELEEIYEAGIGVLK